MLFQCNCSAAATATQVFLEPLFPGGDDFTDLAVGQPLPYEDRDLNFFRGEALAGGHDCASSLAKIAIANFTRLRPSRIPARKNRVRKCCLTVRGLMLSWPAISLLLQPCTSKFKTC